MTAQTVSTARDAIVALPLDDPILVAVRRRFVEAIEEAHHCARLLGLDPCEQTAPLSLRADAWLWRSSRGERP